jgi:hypothetical protein|tara:strand:+ start:472 stop:603 length:132 start_codon:yes stop_codon:yes gene_type:complete
MFRFCLFSTFLIELDIPNATTKIVIITQIAKGIKNVGILISKN